MSRPAIIDRVASHGYVVFENGLYNLNLIGVRSTARVANAFDDLFYCVYKNEGGWVVHEWQCTTDPGTYWLEHPERVEGTAILVPNQYRGVYGLGLHRGQYEALTQQHGKVAIYRDADRDNILDPTAGPEWGYFGINIHKAGLLSSKVDKWSAGCQVFKRTQDFNTLMTLVKKAIPLWGDKFTYTLLGD